MIVRDPSLHPGKVPVTFTIPSAVWADSIHLVGDFNNWSKQSHPLIRNGGDWVLSLELEEGRAYRYQYLFNQTDWNTDSNADQYVPNRDGGYDSVVIT